MRALDLAVAVVVFVGSAGVTALLTVLFIHYGLGVPPSVLRLNALISAGALSIVLTVAISGLTRGKIRSATSRTLTAGRGHKCSGARQSIVNHWRSVFHVRKKPRTVTNGSPSTVGWLPEPSAWFATTIRVNRPFSKAPPDRLNKPDSDCRQHLGHDG